MRGSLSLLFGVSIAGAALWIGGCNGPTSHVGGDAGPSDDAPGRCDPQRGACRVTLWCDDFVCEAVRLTDGEVRSEEPGWDFDVRAYLGRYLGLTASAGFCRFGASSGTSTAEFARLEDVPGDAASCSWAEGGNLLCGVNTATYDPTCVGDGLLVRDGAGTLHRLRVVEDGQDARGHFVTLEWSAISP
jgi:hypothetical protein